MRQVYVVNLGQTSPSNENFFCKKRHVVNNFFQKSTRCEKHISQSHNIKKFGFES